jgi:hypothetical protein
MRHPEAFRKDPEEERFLTELNESLQSLEEAGYRDLPERYATLHVIGVPRAGTTLATQLVAAHLDVGYINKLIAAFWKAPTAGIRLSRKLLPDSRPHAFASTFGLTRDVQEPHEFGYFWRWLLRYEDLSDLGDEHAETIDWHRVRRVLINMTWAFQRPIVFKSFWLGMHIRRIQSLLPKTCFLRVRRDPLETALSLLRMREEVLRSADAWASMKPKEYSWLRRESIPVQLAGQVLFLERMLDGQVASVGGRNVVESSYERLCEDPNRVIEEVGELLRRNESGVSRVSVATGAFKVRRPSQSAPQELVMAIRKARTQLEDRS